MIILEPYIRSANYYETDQMGIIHHANYIRWFEEARVDFMNQLGFGYAQATLSGVDFAVTGVSCEYKSMVRFGDTVQIETRISFLSISRMSVRYHVNDVKTHELRAIGETNHCYFHNQRQCPVSLKKELPELYDLFCEHYSETT